MRCFALVALLVGACVVESTSTTTQQATATTISPSKSAFSVDEPIAVTFSGFAGTPTDWISIARTTDDDTTVIAWTWTDSSSDGAATLTAHLAAGDYEVRGYFDYQGSQDYIVRARETFSVVPPPPPPPPPAVDATLSTSKSSYLVDETIAVDFGGLPANPLNWIGLYTAGAPSASFISYRYVETGSGQVTFSGLAAGSYEARAFLNDGFDSVGSAAFTVTTAAATTPSIATSKSLYAQGESIVVTYSTNGHATDWIGLSPVGSPATTYIKYAFIDGSGTQTFDALPAGDYEARYYLDDGFVIASQAAFTVAATLPSGQVSIATDKASYVVGEPVVVTYLKNHATDWIAIAPAGAPATSYIDFAYVDATFTKTFTGLAAGNYEARYFRDDGFVIAAVATFTISSTTTPPGAGPVTLSTSKSIYTDKQKIQVHYTNLGGPKDWISLALVGSPDNTFRAYQYTNGVTDGHLLFGEIEPGTYEVRAMRSDSFVVEQRFTFTVVSHKSKK